MSKKMVVVTFIYPGGRQSAFTSPQEDSAPQIETEDIQESRWEQEGLTISDSPFCIDVPDRRLKPLAELLKDGTTPLGDIQRRLETIFKSVKSTEEVIYLWRLANEMINEVMALIAANRRSAARYRGPKLPYSLDQAITMFKFEHERIQHQQGSQKELTRLAMEVCKFAGEPHSNAIFH